MSGDLEGSQGKGRFYRDWKELVGQDMGFQTKSHAAWRGGAAKAHTPCVRKQWWSPVHLKLCVLLILHEYLQQVRSCSQHLRGTFSYLLNDL